jgi:hypothetical protein
MTLYVHRFSSPRIASAQCDEPWVRVFVTRARRATFNQFACREAIAPVYRLLAGCDPRSCYLGAASVLHFTNLQPLWADHNRRKGDKVTFSLKESFVPTDFQRVRRQSQTFTDAEKN